MLQRYFSFVFHLPLALVGVPHAAALVHMQFNLLYQFWIHTELVGKCGPLEWILNTPSHHRVHHGNGLWLLFIIVLLLMFYVLFFKRLVYNEKPIMIIMIFFYYK